ncbi:hypothetical protein [Synechococcus sp. CS-1327]|uniref:hypothetical protein n=1 Tax=Synechococcus sp. CS-1327 TaxID=2847977 RepID=UPI00223C02F7|nr:hypothetical protein [Synechococcus sp. CS-1327]MCT0231908.1 hypothetical protein [Synechococcus sp. CS-1327]
MSASPYLGVKDLAKALSRSDRDIRLLARDAKGGSNSAEWPVLRDRTTGEPITDKDGWAYAVITSTNGLQGRPLSGKAWSFRQVKPPQIVTAAQRYLLPGITVGRDQKIFDAIAAAAGINPGAPVRVLGGAKQNEPTQVILADSPGPVLGMLLRPEGKREDWKSRMGDRVEVLVKGTLLLPAEGPIGMGPGLDRLLWDPEVSCWRGEPQKGRSLLELLGSWGLDHQSDGSEPVAVLIGEGNGLRLEWMYESNPDGPLHTEPIVYELDSPSCHRLYWPGVGTLQFGHR